MTKLRPAFSFTDDLGNEALMWSDKNGRVLLNTPTEEMNLSVNDALGLAEALKKVALNAEPAKRKVEVRHED